MNPFPRCLHEVNRKEPGRFHLACQVAEVMDVIFAAARGAKIEQKFKASLNTDD